MITSSGSLSSEPSPNSLLVGQGYAVSKNAKNSLSSYDERLEYLFISNLFFSVFFFFYEPFISLYVSPKLYCNIFKLSLSRDTLLRLTNQDLTNIKSL